MSVITIGKSKRPVSIDVQTLLKTRALIQAGSGGGKSYLLRKMAEELFGKVQVFIVDRDGEFASLREKYNFVLAGDDGDTPTDVRSVRLLAERLLELRASAVFDLYDSFRTKPIQRKQWVRGLLEAVMDAPKKLWRPLVLFVDEAHIFCPETLPKGRDQVEREIISGCKDAMVSLATAGRKRGFCAVWATQRLAKLDKDASAELLNRFVGQTIEDVDVDRAAELMSVSREDKALFKASLKNLDPGNFYGFGRAVSKDRLLFKVGRVKTTHPESGSGQYVSAPPPPPEKIRALLPKLKDLPAEVETKARTELQLKKEVKRLQDELVRAKKLQSQAVKVKTVEVPKVKERVVEVPILKPSDIKKLERFFGQIGKCQEHLGSYVQKLHKTVSSLESSIGKTLGAPKNPGKPLSVPPSPSPKAPIRKPKTAPVRPGEFGDQELVKGERKILEVLAQFSPGSRTKSQLGTLTNLTPSGGTFLAYYGRLKRKGYILEEADGSIVITEDGLALFGDALPNAPQTPEEHLTMWRSKLVAGERRMLDALIEAYPESHTKQTLGEAVSMEPTGGTFLAYLGTLRRNKLAVINEDDTIQAAEFFFEAVNA